MQVFQLPKALAYPLFYKLVAPNSSSVTRDAILSWFEEKNVVQVCLVPSLCICSDAVSREQDGLVEGHVLPFSRLKSQTVIAHTGLMSAYMCYMWCLLHA